jgi:hypothetical protein
MNPCFRKYDSEDVDQFIHVNIVHGVVVLNI